MPEKILRTFEVTVSIQKTYKINIYEPEPQDKPMTFKAECAYALEVARERAKDEEEWGEQDGTFVISNKEQLEAEIYENAQRGGK